MLLLLLSCQPDAGKPDAAEPIDLVTRLGTAEARAGVVSDPAALWGGISGEGAPGDVKIYNDRVRFIIEAAGDGAYYGDYGGALIDADLVRPDGVPGRDLIEESVVMAGLGRTVDAAVVEVVQDGLDGGDAVVRVVGPGAPLRLLTGALENPGLVPDLDLTIDTTYRLAPGAWTLEVTTTVTNGDGAAVVLELGDVAFVAQEVADAWAPGGGFDALRGASPELLATVGRSNEGALALVADTGALSVGATSRLLGEIAPVLAGFGPAVTIEPGARAVWTRRIGVAPDPATLLAEKRAREDDPVRALAGVVRDDTGGPVAGARMHLLGGSGDVLAMAVTDATGAWSTTVREADAGGLTGVATGLGPGLVLDVPAGAGEFGPYVHDPASVLASVTAGATPLAFAEGYGVSAAGDPATRTLVRPGAVAVRVRDGGPAVVRFCREGGAPSVEGRLVAREGCAATVLVRDGDAEVALPAGSYAVTAWRGVRDEVADATVRVEAGARAELTLDITRAWDVPGAVSGDPHTHASPSGDGKVSMTGRLLSMAATGVDLHFGTDHDHVVDYNPLLRALGIGGRLRSVVADEVSPVLRGHFNVWPAAVRVGANGGAPRWWHGYADTAEIFGWMRAMVGPDGIVQVNHPAGGSGMFDLAGYDPATGRVRQPDHWSDDFDAVEILNANEVEPYLPYWLDLIQRGVPATPVGVSDAHGPLSGGLGYNLTWFLSDVPAADTDDDALRAVMARGATVVSRGPFIEARVGEAWAPGGTFPAGSTLDVTVHAASWVPVDRVVLLQDGVAVTEVACEGQAPVPCSARLPLAPARDAVYVVTAEADRPMAGPAAGVTAWAATSWVRVDVGGDGWTAPLPPFVAR